MTGVRPFKFLPLFLYLLFQAVFIVFFSNGPFIDEAIYITSGIRVLEGYAANPALYDYHYRDWFTGSLFLWPPVAALAYGVAGLAGARLAAVACTAAALLLFQLACEGIFNKSAAWWMALALSVNGLFFSLGHLAAYDSLALFLSALSFYLLTRSDSGWGLALIAGIAFAGAVSAKYGYLLAIVPILGVHFIIRQPRLRVRDAAIFILIAVAGILAHNLLVLKEVMPGALANYLAHEKPLSRGALIVLQVQWVAAPLIVTLFLKYSRASGGLFLVGLFLLGPLYHVCSGQLVSAPKHVVIGLFFAYPLVGLTLREMWKERKILVLLLFFVLVVDGLSWTFVQDRTWSDVRLVSQELLAKVSPTDRIAAHKAWSYRLYLYASGRIDSPTAVYDPWYIENRQPDICQLAWIVGERDITTGIEDDFYGAAKKCGFKQTLVSQSMVYVPSPVGFMERHQQEVALFRRAGGR